MMNSEYSQYSAAQPKSIVARLVMKTGLVQSEAAANNIATAFAIICFAFAGYLAFGGSSATPPSSASTPAIGTPGPGGIPQP